MGCSVCAVILWCAAGPLKELQGQCMPALYGVGFCHFDGLFYLATALVSGENPSRRLRAALPSAQQVSAWLPLLQRPPAEVQGQQLFAALALSAEPVFGTCNQCTACGTSAPLQLQSWNRRQTALFRRLCIVMAAGTGPHPRARHPAC